MSKTQRIHVAAGVLMLSLAPAASAFAHPGHGAHTLLDGLSHPFSGMDHVLAMIAVGLWAGLKGRKALWAWPAAFVAAMLSGFALSRLGVTLPLVEPAILASVVVIGGCAAAALPAPTGLGAVLVAIFGLAHGHAHGLEASGAGWDFPLGFMASTAALHLIGAGAALGLTRLRQSVLARLLGASAAVGGLVLAFAA